MRKIAHFLQYLSYRLVMGTLALAPVERGSKLAGRITNLIGRKMKRDKRAMQQLAIFFPDLSAQEHRHIVDKSWQNAGSTAFELPFLPIWASDAQRVIVSDPQNFLTTRDTSKGVMCISGHFGNWELMAAMALHLDTSISCFYRPLRNQFLEDHIRQQREKMLLGGEMLPAKSRGVQTAIKKLNQGQAVGILNDVYERKGPEIAFFGVETKTNTIAATLAERCDVPILAASAFRRENCTFEVQIEQITRSQHKDKAQRILETTQNINDYIEKQIRCDPSQWLWSLDRWKRTHIWNEEQKSAQLGSHFV